MRRLARLLGATGLAAVLALSTSTASGMAAPATPSTEDLNARGEPPPQLRRDGRWLVDQHGRVVIVHGLNLVWKHAPYVPPATAEGFTAADARWMRRHGFNGARLGTLWAGVTPERPGVADPSYLRRWQRVMDLLAEQRIWMQLDFHQDQWHEQYGGEGVPDWAAERPAPFSAAPPVQAPFPTGYWTPEVSTVFDRFWANTDGLLDGWAAAWRIVAERWRDQPYSMGYDLLNEPWAGVEWPLCLTNGCPSTYEEELQPAFEKALAAIREVDPDGIVWFEPQQFAGGQQLETYFEPVPGERNLGLSWHNYCPQVFLQSQGVPGADVEQCRSYSAERNRHALDQGRRMRAATLMSEFGATDTVQGLHIDVDVADRHLMGWVHWAYKHWNDPTTADSDQGLFRDDADRSTVKTRKLRALVRTYAQATAGAPLESSFDATTGYFRYRYRHDPAVEAPTEIFVSPLHYPDGFEVQVRNGRVTGRDGRLVRIATSRDAEVTVVVRGR
jgi:Cellulase (glycosyl hydrolase family 5)/Glycoside hydrolase family 5 C-terminal domain